MNNSIKKQQGVVLLVALIALVVMSLGALAIVRSVDTNSLIAGNIAFKQATTSAGDFALDAVTTFIASKDTTTVTTQVSDYLNNSKASDGYYAIVNTTGAASTSTMFNIGDEASWANAGKVAALVNADLTAAGLTASYVIERMCTTNNATPTPSNCLFAAAATNQNSVGGNAVSPAPSTAGGAPLYRVTARIAGPQNAVSYIQAFTN